MNYIETELKRLKEERSAINKLIMKMHCELGLHIRSSHGFCIFCKVPMMGEREEASDAE